MKKNLNEKFKIKDVVFLAIISAVTMATCAVMPLVASLQLVVFGIAHVVTSLQISLFFAIGLMKVPKRGALFLMALLTGLFQLLMAPPMFFSNLVIGIILELFTLLVFRGFTSTKAIFIAAALYSPLSLPFNLLYNYLFGRQAMVAVITRLPWLTVLMVLAVVVLSAGGAWIGIKISKELKKSGAIMK